MGSSSFLLAARFVLRADVSAPNQKSVFSSFLVAASWMERKDMEYVSSDAMSDADTHGASLRSIANVLLRSPLRPLLVTAL
jgi:hypothetical protein